MAERGISPIVTLSALTAVAVSASVDYGVSLGAWAPVALTLMALAVLVWVVNHDANADVDPLRRRRIVTRAVLLGFGIGLMVALPFWSLVEGLAGYGTFGFRTNSTPFGIGLVMALLGRHFVRQERQRHATREVVQHV